MPAEDLIVRLLQTIETMQARLAVQENELIQLKAENAQLKAENTQLRAENKRLADEITRLKTNSQTSSKPPSSDRHNPNKPAPRSLREKSALKPGGQPGHTGHHLAFAAAPDETIPCPPPAQCPVCHGELGTATAVVDAAGQPQIEVRQVIDLPPPKRHVTSYEAPRVCCAHCHQIVAGTFPAHVPGPVSYGPGVQATVVFLAVKHLVPSERIVEIMGELCACPMSPGGVATILRRAGEASRPVLAEIKAHLRRQPWIGFDETSLSLSGKLHWLHTASSPLWTLLHAHQSRYGEGMKSGGLLGDYAGRAIHDFLPAYQEFAQCAHGLCNAHHLRDLRFVHEELKQAWAGEMMAYLRRTKKLSDAARAPGSVSLTETELAAEKRLYREIISRGRIENPEPPSKAPGKRGRPARGKALNLLDRFSERHGEVMAFLESDAPFDNNHAERDLRMMKTRQKISGCFRSEEVLESFTAIRSVIATAAKHSVNALSAIKALFVPAPSLSGILS